MLFFFLQAESQRNRKTKERQDEHVHHGTLGDGADVSRDVKEIRQADCSTNGRTTFKNYTGCCHLIHGGPLQAGLSQRSRAQNPHTSSKIYTYYTRAHIGLATKRLRILSIEYSYLKSAIT